MKSINLQIMKSVRNYNNSTLKAMNVFWNFIIKKNKMFKWILNKK